MEPDLLGLFGQKGFFRSGYWEWYAMEWYGTSRDGIGFASFGCCLVGVLFLPFFSACFALRAVSCVCTLYWPNISCLVRRLVRKVYHISIGILVPSSIVFLLYPSACFTGFVYYPF
ncbi:hypothetical protein V8F06_003848 [Rhypophila decipiens]